MNSNFFNPFFTVKVMDGLFIGNHTASKEQEFIQNNKFSLIVNTSPRQFKIAPSSLYSVNNFYWQESAKKPNLIKRIEMEKFADIFKSMIAAVAKGTAVLVVSDRGHSRAITFCLLFLMDHFKWGLYKALEYLNSKRENLEVRASYLKLLVDYERVALSNQKLFGHEQEWVSYQAKSTEEQVLINTFRNTRKKMQLRDLNHRYEKELRTNLKSFNVNFAAFNKESLHKKKAKCVKFSNQIEIIQQHSATSSVFPQYEQLSSENAIEFSEVTIKNQNSVPSTISPIKNEKNLSNSKTPDQKFEHQNGGQLVFLGDYNQSQSKDVTKKDENSNSQKNPGRMLNIKKIEKTGNNTKIPKNREQLVKDSQKIQRFSDFQQEKKESMVEDPQKLKQKSRECQKVQISTSSDNLAIEGRKNAFKLSVKKKQHLKGNSEQRGRPNHPQQSRVTTEPDLEQITINQSLCGFNGHLFHNLKKKNTAPNLPGRRISSSLRADTTNPSQSLLRRNGMQAASAHKTDKNKLESHGHAEKRRNIQSEHKKTNEIKLKESRPAKRSTLPVPLVSQEQEKEQPKIRSRDISARNQKLHIRPTSTRKLSVNSKIQSNEKKNTDVNDECCRLSSKDFLIKSEVFQNSRNQDLVKDQKKGTTQISVVHQKVGAHKDRLKVYVDGLRRRSKSSIDDCKNRLGGQRSESNQQLVRISNTSQIVKESEIRGEDKISSGNSSHVLSNNFV